MRSIVLLFQSLFRSPPIATEIIRAKAYEIWKAQGGGTINPDANWQAAIVQLELAEKQKSNFFVTYLTDREFVKSHDRFYCHQHRDRDEQICDNR